MSQRLDETVHTARGTPASVEAHQTWVLLGDQAMQRGEGRLQVYRTPTYRTTKCGRTVAACR